MTFTIVGIDKTEGDIGIATSSKVVAVGAVVPHVKAGVGAVATQAKANYTYGPIGIEMLEKGMMPKEIVKELTKEDGERDHRQVAVMDFKGEAYVHTGEKCIEWKGHLIDDECVALGNIIAGSEVISAMVEAFKASEGMLALKLAKALKAGEDAGGDRRGKQSAALIVVRKGYRLIELGEKFVDIRVDDHHEPVTELLRILNVYLNY